MAYPGLSLYHEGMDIVALVSTGEDVWRLQVRGPTDNETWVNYGKKNLTFKDFFLPKSRAEVTESTYTIHKAAAYDDFSGVNFIDPKNMDVKADMKNNQGGLALYVDAKLVGKSLAPLPRPKRLTSNSTRYGQQPSFSVFKFHFTTADIQKYLIS